MRFVEPNYEGEHLKTRNRCMSCISVRKKKVADKSAWHTSRYVAKATTLRLASEKTTMRCKVSPWVSCTGKSAANSLRMAVTLTATSLSGGRALVQSFNDAHAFENRDKRAALIGESRPERS